MVSWRGRGERGRGERKAEEEEEEEEGESGRKGRGERSMKFMERALLQNCTGELGLTLMAKTEREKEHVCVCGGGCSTDA